MRLKSIKKPFAPTDHAQSTDVPLAAYESICTSQQRGRYCEDLVAIELRKLGYKILAQRYKIANIKVDLLVRHPRLGLGIVEVKSLSGWDWLSTRVSQKQRLRLQRATEILVERSRGPVALMLATVDKKQAVKIFDEIW